MMLGHMSCTGSAVPVGLVCPAKQGSAQQNGAGWLACASRVLCPVLRGKLMLLLLTHLRGGMVGPALALAVACWCAGGDQVTI